MKHTFQVTVIALLYLLLKMLHFVTYKRGRRSRIPPEDSVSLCQGVYEKKSVGLSQEEGLVSDQWRMRISVDRVQENPFFKSPTHSFFGFWASLGFHFYSNEQLGSLLVDVAHQLSFYSDSLVVWYFRLSKSSQIHYLLVVISCKHRVIFNYY